MRTLVLLGISLAALAFTACGGDDDDGEEKDCAAYCTSIMANCTTTNAQYANNDQCLASCNALPAGKEGDMAGNSVACRTYHAGAARMDPVTHCVHAGPGGAGACGANCEGFCAIAQAECPGTFADATACNTACAGFSATEKYDTGDVAGNTFACRLYHLTVATTIPTPHCTHIPANSSTCI